MIELEKETIQKAVDINLVFPNNYGLTDISGKDLLKLKESLDKSGGNSQQPILVREVGSLYEIID